MFFKTAYSIKLNRRLSLSFKLRTALTRCMWKL